MARYFLQVIYVLAFLLFISAKTLPAKEITLSWEPSPSSGVTGYKVYYQGGSNVAPLTGTGAYLNGTQVDSPVDVGNVLTVTLTGLDDDPLYSFAVTAYNDSTESAYSTIVTEEPAGGVVSDGDGAADEPQYSAPVLNSVQANGSDFILQWSLPSGSETPSGGYDIYIDGTDTNSTYNTSLQTATVSGLSNGTHCFQIEARYVQLDPRQFSYSSEVCADSSIPDSDSDNDGSSSSTTSSEDQIEAGRVDIGSSWQTVTLNNIFSDPVVLVGPPTYRDAEAGLVRIRNVQSSSFEIQFSEWTYADGAHSTENVPYLVLESGRHEMSDGSVWEAGSFYLGDSGVMNGQNYLQGFSGAPRLLLTVQTCDDSAKPVVARARNVDSYGFDAGLFTQESLMGSHGQEAVGYLAVWKSDGSGTVTVNGSTQSYELSEIVVGSTFVAVDESAVKLEEEQSADAEVSHVSEQVAVVQVGESLFMQAISCEEMDTVTLRVSEDGAQTPAGGDSIGVRRAGSFLLTANTPPSVAETVFSFGFADVQPGDTVFSGDWNGDGVDTVGMWRNNTIYLRNSNSTGSADIVFSFGRATDQIIVGDWDGDGIDTVGYKRDN
ncbi:MAG: fibronectin type III domain-containing protein, partial [Deltaproteobacteria bacterium]|nr:fibronectin type III domain-containing protein [Deltaproteobacteria bacterium]